MKSVILLQQRDSRALTRWAERWGTPDLLRRVNISYSTRLRSSLGRVRPRSGHITLNAQLATAPRATFLEVLCHEVAHVAAYLLHGNRAKPHGPEWRQLVRLAGYQPSTRLRCPGLIVADVHRPVSRPRVRCRCPICGTDHFLRRPNTRHHCGVCYRQGRLVKLQPPGRESRIDAC